MPEETLKTVRRVFRFPVLGRLWKYLVAVGVYSAVVVQFGPLLDDGAHHPPPRAGEMIIAGILFGWLMSFRTQTSYTRWWDGRGLWGQLVNDSRNMVLKTAAYVDDPVEREKMASVVLRFAETLRDRLRLPAKHPGPHLPMAAAGEAFQMIRRWQAEGKIDGYALLALDRHGQEFMNICGACEKIRATPLAASYRGLLRKGIAGYLLLLPWLMFYETGWATVAICLLTAYALVGLELIATSIEDPFGYDGDDLPLDDIVETIRKATGYAPPA